MTLGIPLVQGGINKPTTQVVGFETRHQSHFVS
jgi:hypothetical protein